MQKLSALLHHRPRDSGVSVAQCGDADAAQKVKILIPLSIDQVNAFAAGKEQRVASIRLQQEFLLRRLYSNQVHVSLSSVRHSQGRSSLLHATITSVPSLTRVETRSG